MPLYLYRHPETGEIKEVIQRMSEPHVYGEEGVIWERIWTIPTTNAEGGIINPFSAAEFLQKTKNQKGNIGNVMDLAREYSEMRATQSSSGRDPYRDTHFKDYSKKRAGKTHPEDDRPEK